MSARGLTRYLDVVIVVLAAIPALALGAPVFGYVMGAAGWVLQRVIQANEGRFSRRFPEPRQQLTAHLFEAFGRIWLLAGVIIVAGVVGHRADGLTAAIVIFAAYSIAFALRVMAGPPTTAASASRSGAARSTAVSRSGAGNRRRGRR